MRVNDLNHVVGREPLRHRIIIGRIGSRNHQGIDESPLIPNDQDIKIEVGVTARTVPVESVSKMANTGYLLVGRIATGILDSRFGFGRECAHCQAQRGRQN